MRPLNMVICIKPVPDPRYFDRLSLDPKTKLLRREGVPITMNPLDKNALEEALRIRETKGGKVTVISMGPSNTVESVMSAFALGADQAVLLVDKDFAGADTGATAFTLASGIKKLGKFDLILLGDRSLDGSTGQIGPRLAEYLNIPSVTNVSKIELIDEGTLRVRTKFESGYMVIETQLPVVLAVTKEINEPRLPSVFGAIWATEKQIEKWSADDLGVDKTKIGLAGSTTHVLEVFNIDVRRRGEVLNGEPSEIARQLIQKLRTDGVLPRA